MARSSRVLPGTDGAGMAFVEMPDEKEALTAIKKINGKIIGGTAIMVEGS